MNVFSAFDGMSCGQIALERAGIKADNYFASEVDKHAIKVTQHNYPNTIQLGDIHHIKGSDLPQIDLMIGGSPCQGFSYAGAGLNFDDPRSKLFFEFVRLLGEVKPKFFLLENVGMKQEWQDVISEHLGVQPVKINSALVSAQNRVRLYWANFPISQPEDRGVVLDDVLDEPDGWGKATILGRRINDRGVRDDYNKDVPVTQCLEVRDTNRDKCGCLTTVDKDNVRTPLPIGRHVDVFGRGLPFRYYTLSDCAACKPSLRGISPKQRVIVRRRRC